MTLEVVVKVQPTDDEIRQALDLRQEIFIVEEGRARHVDADEFDAASQHVVALIDDKVVGTLRLYLLQPQDHDIKIGRVAVRKDLRGLGIGAKMMAAAHRWAARKYDSVYLHAQVGVVGFYEKLGYIKESDVFMEAGTPHVVMRLLEKEFIQSV